MRIARDAESCQELNAVVSWLAKCVRRAPMNRHDYAAHQSASFLIAYSCRLVCGFIRAIIGQAVRWSKLFDLPPIHNDRSYAVAHFKPDFACGDRSGTSSWMFFIFALGECKNEKRKTGTYHCT
jgi:hypothetical protein